MKITAGLEDPESPPGNQQGGIEPGAVRDHRDTGGSNKRMPSRLRKGLPKDRLSVEKSSPVDRLTGSNHMPAAQSTGT